MLILCPLVMVPWRLILSPLAVRERNFLKIKEADTPNHSDTRPMPIADDAKEADTVSTCSEREKNVLKIREVDTLDLSDAPPPPIADGAMEADTDSTCSEKERIFLKIKEADTPNHSDARPMPIADDAKEAGTVSTCSEREKNALKIREVDTLNLSDARPPPIADTAKEADTVSTCSERKKTVLKIKVKQPGSSSKADDNSHLMENSRGWRNETNEIGPASSVSVDAPNHQEANEPSCNAVNHNIEEVNSCHDYESRMTASIGSSAKLNKDGIKELQCTADSKKSVGGGHSSLVIQRSEEVAVHPYEHSCLRNYNGDGGATLTVVSDEEVSGKRKKEKKKDKKKKDKEKKRKREEKSGEKDHSSDPEYLERKRQKKEKKRLEKQLAKMKHEADGKSLNDSVKLVPESSKGNSTLEGSNKLQGNVQDHNLMKGRETSSGPKLKIKIRSHGSGNG